MPTPVRRIYARLLTLTLGLTALLATALAPTAHAADEPVYTGPGWQANTVSGIYSLSPDPYEIVFADSTARSKLAGYFTAPAAQVTVQVGVRVTVTNLLDTTPAGTCPARHRIVVHYTYRPMGLAGMSQARACYANANRSAWGGHILMDSEYWTSPNWFSTDPTANETRRKDATAHELGHILGLDHPNTDIDRDGTVEAGECVAAYGLKPVLCSPNRGIPTRTSATGRSLWVLTEGGRFTTEFDVPGLRQLLANYTLRQG
ncbi:hypothetical protein AB0L55_37365 [Streptomyces anthocyanicus]|uniref:hypothetical protein n=1 Tax=Streptomyces anthocyanicus TaxID=68174 RepID=UPI00341F5531